MKNLRLAGVAAVLLATWGLSAYAQDSANQPAMTADEKAAAKKIYFERCAGCHGVLRKGEPLSKLIGGLH